EVHRMARCVLAHFVAVHPVEPGAVGIRAIGVLIAERGAVAPAIPFLAGGRAGVAAHTGVEVDNETQLFRGRTGECGHRRSAGGCGRDGAPSGSNRGQVRASASAAISIRTLRSYQAAWPVIGSLLE